jgi:hypothetical protein
MTHRTRTSEIVESSLADARGETTRFYASAPSETGTPYSFAVSELEVVTKRNRPELQAEVGKAIREVWPEFVFHDAIVKEYITRVGSYFGDYDVILLDGGTVVATGWGVPFAWSGTITDLPDGYDGTLVAAVDGYDSGVKTDTLSLMGVSVRSGRQGEGLANHVLKVLRDRAASSGLRRVVAPVRPVLKARYPLTSMAEFARWLDDDGLHVDPWVRTHQRLGACVLGPAERSMVITGSVSEWESWTSMLFPQSGPYVVPDALAVVEIDKEANCGTYVEPNLWMQHV